MSTLAGSLPASLPTTPYQPSTEWSQTQSPTPSVSSRFSPSFQRSNTTSTTPRDSVYLGGFAPSALDRDNAELLMQQERQLQGKPPKKPFTSKESSPLLAKITSGEFCDTRSSILITPGVVQILLEDFGAQGQGMSNTSLRSKTGVKVKMPWKLGQNEMPYPANFLLLAVEHCNADIVSVLLQYADAPSKTQALRTAMRTDDPLKVQYAMASGATLCNASLPHHEFLDIVHSGSCETLSALVRSSTLGPCQNCLDTALVQAVQQECPEGQQKARALLESSPGANTTFQDSEALFTAIRNRYAELVDAILSRIQQHQVDKGLLLDTLSRATVLAYEKADPAQPVETRYKTVRMCLDAGGTGNCVSQVLVAAMKGRQFGLVLAMIKHGVPVYSRTDTGTAVVDAAVVTGRRAVVEAILKIGNGPTTGHMKNALAAVMTVEQSQDALFIADLLLQSGLRGHETVSEALHSAIKRLVHCTSQDEYNAFYGFADLFLSQGAADVNFRGGELLVLAATHSLNDVLQLLVGYRPSQASVNKCILPAMRVMDSVRRKILVGLLLQAGAQGATVDIALAMSAGMGKEHVDLTTLLLQHSSVNTQKESPLVSAISSGCIEQIRLVAESATLSSSTVADAWTKIKILNDEGLQLEVYKLLLKNGDSVQRSLCDEALTSAARLGHRGQALCELMLQHGASPDRLNGLAVVSAAKSLSLDTLKLLSAYAKSSETYTTALGALTGQGPGWLTQEGQEVACFLLERGASGQPVESALCQAASHHNLDAAQFLRAGVGPVALGQALMHATMFASDPAKWPSDDDVLWLVTDLLEAGASSEFVNLVLLDTIKTGQATADSLETLMMVGDGRADVNFQGGEALRMLVRQGNPKLLNHMLECASQVSASVSQETMTQAFAEAITTDFLKDEKVILEIIDVLVQPRKNTPQPDFKAHLPSYGNRAPLFACIYAHPNFPKLVRKLVSLGCDLKVETLLPLYDDENVEAEPANLLTWALCLTDENLIASGTIRELIEARVDVNFTSRISLATPLILAAKYHRGDIAKALIAKKADVSKQDHFDRSALFYASRVGNLDAVKALVKAGSSVDDGSLHEAARNLHDEVVRVLLKAGHHTNYGSSHKCHEGREALQEVAFKAQPSQSQVPALKKVIQALTVTGRKGEPNKSSVLRERGRLHEKNALFLALDNPFDGCLVVCRALLDMMWNFVDEPTNVYALKVHDPATDRVTLLYVSPTMYLHYGLFQAQEEHRVGLLELLSRMRCQDRYYAELGAEQPLDAVGLPDDIAKSEAEGKEKERKEREKYEKQQEKDNRKRYDEQMRGELEQSSHERKLLHARETAAQKRQQDEWNHFQKQSHAADTHDQKLQMKQRMTESEQYWTAQKAKFEAARTRKMNMLAMENQRNEQGLKLGFDRQMAQQKEAKQVKQMLLAEQESKKKLHAQQAIQQLKARGEVQKLEFKKKQNSQAKDMLVAKTADKREGHTMQMEKMSADQQTLRMKAAMKYLDAQKTKKKAKAIGQ